MKTLEAQLQDVHQQQSKLLRAIDERNKKHTIQCGGCNKHHPINALTAIQTHFYVPPRGHTEGDYWSEGELQFVCPKTGIINRLLFDNNDVPYDKRSHFEHNPEEQFKRAYKQLFSTINDVHEKTADNWVNNFYVDEHRAKFGLVEKRASK